MAFRYERGLDGAENSPDTAAKFANKACVSGSARGCSLVALSYQFGTHGFLKNEAKAEGLLAGACAKGYGTGCVALAALYIHAATPAPEKAIALLLVQCQKDSAAACLDLSFAFSNLEPPKQSEALAAALRACDLGGASGCAEAAWMHLDGYAATADHAKAAGFARRACDRGSPLGCHYLGRICDMGSAGGERDVRGAYRLFTAACNAGQEDACHMAGTYEENGTAGPPNREAALYFYKLACDGKVTQACDRLRALKAP